MSTSHEFLHYFPDLTWDLPPEVIERRSVDLICDIKMMIDELTCLSEENINFNIVCESLADMEAEMEREKSIIEYYYIASPVIQVRNKCLQLIKTWSDFIFEISMRRDLYDLLIKVQSVENSLPYESARYLEKSLLYKRRNGLHLRTDVREKLKALLNMMSDLCIDFNNNIRDVDMKIEFEKMELFGMSEDFLMGLDEKYGKYIVTLTEPHVVPILKHCSVIRTRQIIEIEYNSRCINQNVRILEELLKLRDERANILGYKTHADFVTEILMSKSAASVYDFLTFMFDKIQYASDKEMKRLLQLKKKECEEMWIEFDGKINPYDLLYYENMVETKDYNIDKNLIKEYFPFQHVTTQLFDIFQTVLGLIFEQVEDPPVIHPDVTLYAVYDQQTNSLMGYFYMDLFSRPFKFSNAACIGIQAACHYKNITHIGCVVLTANFPKRTPDKPSLLTHEEVRTYFHEFGHVMHHICSRTKYKIFHGTSVERDFVEAPSQMFENWCWDKDILKKLSHHYETWEPMPDDLIIKIILSRRANISISHAQQICLSMYNNSNNLAKPFDVLRECMIKYTGIEPTPGTNFAASFGHLCGGFDAQYYGYLWSKVFSNDLYWRLKKEGMFSSVPGLRFRNLILLPGSTKDGSQMLREFIGRDPILDPFMDIVEID